MYIWAEKWLPITILRWTVRLGALLCTVRVLIPIVTHRYRLQVLNHYTLSAWASVNFPQCWAHNQKGQVCNSVSLFSSYCCAAFVLGNVEENVRDCSAHAGFLPRPRQRCQWINETMLKIRKAVCRKDSAGRQLHRSTYTQFCTPVFFAPISFTASVACVQLPRTRRDTFPPPVPRKEQRTCLLQFHL